MKLRTLLSLGYVLVFSLMIALAAITYDAIHSLRTTAEWVAHTQKAIGMANHLGKLMVDMETGERGFVISGDSKFLETHDDGEEQFAAEIIELKKQVADNPVQVALLDEIDQLKNKWLKIAVEPAILLRKKINKSGQSNIDDIAAFVKSGVGKRIMDKLRVKLGEFTQVEKDLLVAREKEAATVAQRSVFIMIFGTVVAIALGIIGMVMVSRSVLRQVGGEPAEIAAITGRIAKGELDIDINENQTLSGIFESITKMAKSLKSNRKMTQDQDWLKTGIAKLNDIVRGEQNIGQLSAKIISELTSYMDAQIGALYLLDDTEKENPYLKLTGSYAYKKRKNLSNKFKLGEGLVGQAFLEKQQIVVSNVPEDYVKITSGLGEAVPRFIVETPFSFENDVIGVIEIGTINEMTDLELQYLEQAVAVTGISFNVVKKQQALEQALKESQELSEELQAQSEELQAQQEELQSANEELQSQQEELKAANEELEEQTMTLKQNESSLISQQEALQAANEELEEKTEFLEKQRAEISDKNAVLAQTSAELEHKAKELEISSRYKSEFLANMSHELRTPLNSILLLSRDLAENKDKHLDKEEIESAEIVYKSGNDLLNLINEILNLSKIEAGKMTLNLNELKVKEFATDIKQHFSHIAKNKGLSLEVSAGDNLPEAIQTDFQKLDQIMKNLISNASKFTEKGGISISINRPPQDTKFSTSGLVPNKTLSIAVSDTGIGIPKDKQHEIFEAFQQADGSTSRKYGGTGLGLSISRELAKLLGGEIQLESTVDKGSTFILYLPENGPEIIPASEAEEAVAKSLSAKAEAEKNKIKAVEKAVANNISNNNYDDIKPQDNSILIIEDDPVFAKLLNEQCRENGFKCLTADNGRDGLQLALDRLPKAIILDIRLPEKDGWEVMDELKKTPATSHIPIHVMSSADNLDDALSRGSIVGTLTKPVSKEDLNEALNGIKNFVTSNKKTLLIVEDNEMQLKAIKKIIGSKDVEVLAADSGKAAINHLKSGLVDCMILDLKLPDISGFELLDELDKMEEVDIPPVIIYTGKDLSKDELEKLQERSETVIVKGAKSEERLLDETALFLHKMGKEQPKEIAVDKDKMFKGQKILVVDDDMRNVFALSKILKQKGLDVLKAENGKKALSILEENGDIDLVLMDIMMPEMNGYETIQRIRDPKSNVKNHDILVLALTAKAMKQDREKCIQAGADDYLSKPVDTERLFSMMRVWLYK